MVPACAFELYGERALAGVAAGDVEGSAAEDAPLAPTSPYSAAKAAGDLLALAYVHTHRTPAVITRSSNNFGPYQYPEKVIPLFVTNALDNEPLPLYGDGKNVRDWLYVLDNCTAIDVDRKSVV